MFPVLQMGLVPPWAQKFTSLKDEARNNDEDDDN
jgi:hypothetical protein